MNVSRQNNDSQNKVIQNSAFVPKTIQSNQTSFVQNQPILRRSTLLKKISLKRETTKADIVENETLTASTQPGINHDSFVRNESKSGYHGELRYGLKHGAGVFMSQNNGLETYTGNWVMNKRTGIGSQKYADGSEYSGNWLDDRKHGQGKLVLADRTTYQGAWRFDQINGTGVLKLAGDKGSYTGEFQDGKKHGLGV